MQSMEQWHEKERYPEEFYYSKNHLWVSVDETLITLGVTHLVPQKVGEVLFLDVPDVGDRVTKDLSFGTLESITDWTALISPVSGLIVDLNLEVTEQPYILNDDPYGSGWILKIEIESEKELVDLIRLPEYKMLKFE